MYVAVQAILQTVPLRACALLVELATVLLVDNPFGGRLPNLEHNIVLLLATWAPDGKVIEVKAPALFVANQYREYFLSQA